MREPMRRDALAGSLVKNRDIKVPVTVPYVIIRI
jgi:hypothetical protein